MKNCFKLSVVSGRLCFCTSVNRLGVNFRALAYNEKTYISKKVLWLCGQKKVSEEAEIPSYFAMDIIRSKKR